MCVPAVYRSTYGTTLCGPQWARERGRSTRPSWSSTVGGKAPGGGDGARRTDASRGVRCDCEDHRGWSCFQDAPWTAAKRAKCFGYGHLRAQEPRTGQKVVTSVVPQDICSLTLYRKGYISRLSLSAQANTQVGASDSLIPPEQPRGGSGGGGSDGGWGGGGSKRRGSGGGGDLE